MYIHICIHIWLYYGYTYIYTYMHSHTWYIGSSVLGFPFQESRSQAKNQLMRQPSSPLVQHTSMVYWVIHICHYTWVSIYITYRHFIANLSNPFSPHFQFILFITLRLTPFGTEAGVLTHTILQFQKQTRRKWEHDSKSLLSTSRWFYIHTLSHIIIWIPPWVHI